MEYDNLHHPRLTPDEFEEKLVEYHASKPVVLSESELRQDLRTTAVHRYRQGVTLLDDLVNSINEIVSSVTHSEQREKLIATTANVDKALVAFAYGHLGYNMCGKADMGLAGHARPILWVPIGQEKQSSTSED